MKRDFLKDLGLTDDQVEKIMSEHGKDVQDVNSKLATAEQERDSFKDQIADRDTQIKELGDKVSDSEDQSNTIKQLQADIKAHDEEAANNLLQVKQDNAVNNYLKDSGVRDAKAVMPFIDKGTIKYDADKGELTGLKEQIDNIKSDHNYLFQPESGDTDKSGIKATVGGDPTGTPTPANDDAFAKALGLAPEK